MPKLKILELLAGLPCPNFREAAPLFGEIKSLQMLFPDKSIDAIIHDPDLIGNGQTLYTTLMKIGHLKEICDNTHEEIIWNYDIITFDAVKVLRTYLESLS